MHTKEAQAVAAVRERRAEPRIQAAQSVLITIANAHPMEGWLLDVSSAGAKFRMPVAVEAGSKLRMEAKDVILYGTVLRCELVHGAYIVAMSLAQPLEVLIEMRRLDAALFSEK